MNVIKSYEVLNNSTDIDFRETIQLMYFAHCYAHIKIVASTLRYANITISDRFSMLSENFDILSSNLRSNKVYVEVNNTVYETELHIYIPLTAYNAGCVVVSAVAENYDVEQVTVDFTIAPSVYDSKIERMTLPDNVFEFSISNKIGRTDICESSAVSSEYYNNEYSSDRLISNGIVNEIGHPVYVAQYQTFIPYELSKEYSSDSNSALSFSAVNTYLTISNNIQEQHYNLSNIREYNTPNIDMYVCWIAYQNGTESEIGAVDCKTQNFSAYIQKTDVNDDVLRSNTTLAADFVLTGLADKWK